MVKNIITIQHTQSVHHTNGMIGSWTDWGLTDLGKERAENIGLSLSAELRGRPCKIFSSDLLRAKQTIEPLSRRLGVEVEFREELREQNLGEAVGKSGEWARENANPEKSIDIPLFHGAETWREFWNRAESFCRNILEDESELIILASHGVFLSIWQLVWVGANVNDFNYNGILRYRGIPGGVSFYSVSDSGEHAIIRLNDPSYMTGKNQSVN